MRPELKLIEKIERYLMNQMSEQERNDFEQKINSDDKLKQEVENQKLLMDGLKRLSIKQKIDDAERSHFLRKLLKKIFLRFIQISVTAATLIWAYFAVYDTKDIEKTAIANEVEIEQPAENDIKLPIQVFEIEAKKANVLETEDGIVLSIPSNAFVTQDGKQVFGNIQLKVQEALDPIDIMNAGLTTLSDSNLLETGGMFNVRAFQDGEELKLRSNKNILVDIPTDNKQKDMQLFEEEKDSTGNINWVNPKPLENYLTTVDINTLDFYPPEYLSALTKYINSNYKGETYYGGKRLFEDNCTQCHALESKVIGPALSGIHKKRSKEWLKKIILNNGKLIAQGDKDAIALYKEYSKTQMNTFDFNEDELEALLEYLEKVSGSHEETRNTIVKPTKHFADSLYYSFESVDGYRVQVTERVIMRPIEERWKGDSIDVLADTLASPKGIAPSKIKTIWNKKFNNTILATKEFEARMPAIHRSCNNEVLNLYINNLDKNLWEIDEMAAKIATGQSKIDFEHFAARKDGMVQISEEHMKNLNEYYLKNQKIFHDAFVKTEKEYWNKQNKLDAKRQQKVGEEKYKTDLRRAQNFEQEFQMNLKETYKQLGMRQPRNVFPRNTMVYRARVQNTGWHNIDRYVYSQTKARKTIDIKKNGKRAVIRYKDLKVALPNRSDYEKVYSYLIPNKLNSFVQMTPVKKGYKYSMNELINYDLVVVGIKGNTTSYFVQERVTPKLITVSELNMTEKDVRKLFKSSKGKSLLENIGYRVYLNNDNKRQKLNRQKRELKQKLMPVVFPCYSPPVVGPILIEDFEEELEPVMVADTLIEIEEVIPDI